MYFYKNNSKMSKKIKYINSIKDFDPPDNMLKEINNFLLKINNNIKHLSLIRKFNNKHWDNIFDNLKIIFKKYYYINNDNYDIEFQDDGIGKPFINLNEKNKELSDVFTISIISAYPDRIHKLFLDGMESNDEYLPFIFHILYKFINKETSTKNVFINYIFKILLEMDIIVDKSIKLEVVDYYYNIMNSIDKKLYYYIDTDTIYLHKDNIDNVCNILNKYNLNYNINNKKKIIFYDNKKIKISK